MLRVCLLKFTVWERDSYFLRRNSRFLAVVADRWQNHYHWSYAMMRLSHRFVASASCPMPIYN